MTYEDVDVESSLLLHTKFLPNLRVLCQASIITFVF